MLNCLFVLSSYSATKLFCTQQLKNWQDLFVAIHFQIRMQPLQSSNLFLFWVVTSHYWLFHKLCYPSTPLPYPDSWRQLSQASWCLLMLGSAVVWLKLIQAATRRWQQEHHIIYNMFNSSPVSLNIFSLYSWSPFIIQLCELFFTIRLHSFKENVSFNTHFTAFGFTI